MPSTVKPSVFSGIPWIFSGFGNRKFGEENLRAKAGEKGFRPVILHQVHSDLVHVLEDVPPERLEGDALITAVSGILLVIKTADCLPILLADERRRIVAAVHAGWRGTRAQIVRKAVEVLVSRFKTDPADLRAALGPCIGPLCYEVGDDVRQSFPPGPFPEKLFIPSGLSGKYFFDLPAANIIQLRSAGVAAERISPAPLCTHCDAGSFSWRRDHDPERRMYSFIGIRA